MDSAFARGHYDMDLRSCLTQIRQISGCRIGHFASALKIRPTLLTQIKEPESRIYSDPSRAKRLPNQRRTLRVSRRRSHALATKARQRPAARLPSLLAGCSRSSNRTGRSSATTALASGLGHRASVVLALHVVEVCLPCRHETRTTGPLLNSRRAAKCV